MNFQSLPSVPTSDELVDKAFSRAKKRYDQLKHTRMQNKAVRLAREKVLTVEKVLCADLDKIISSFPDFSNLPEFYEQLCATQFDLEKVRESLGRVQGVISTIKAQSREAMISLRSDEADPTSVLSMYYGRISSVVRRLKSPLTTLAKTREVMVKFPAVKEMFTVALAGFPNVGKSTLLSYMTTAKPKIANYAFTTKTLNVGYYREGYLDVQVIDTPGTLARFEKMNAIEQMAALALKYVADCVVMIFDPTQSYSLKEQEQLLSHIKDLDKPIIFFVSKKDVADKKVVDKISKKFGARKDVDDLRGAISNLMESS